MTAEILANANSKYYMHSNGEKKWEVYTLHVMPNGRWGVHYQTVDLAKYDVASGSFQSDYLELYGYDSIAELKRVYGELWYMMAARFVAETELYYAETVCAGTRDFCSQIIENRRK